MPNEFWHVDTTWIRLVDGTRAYLHAVIDNFSRRILAWRVCERFDPGNTLLVLLDASRSVTQSKERPTLLTDGGVENFNAEVDALIESGALRRLLAMTDISFSNSLIESWWRVLKHQWLYLNLLDGVRTVRKLVTFYVDEHNTCLPHSAFKGQTPDEMCFGTGDDVSRELEEERKAARTARMEENRGYGPYERASIPLLMALRCAAALGRAEFGGGESGSIGCKQNGVDPARRLSRPDAEEVGPGRGYVHNMGGPSAVPDPVRRNGQVELAKHTPSQTVVDRVGAAVRALRAEPDVVQARHLGHKLEDHLRCGAFYVGFPALEQAWHAHRHAAAGRGSARLLPRFAGCCRRIAASIFRFHDQEACRVLLVGASR